MSYLDMFPDRERWKIALLPSDWKWLGSCRPGSGWLCFASQVIFTFGYGDGIPDVPGSRGYVWQDRDCHWTVIMQYSLDRELRGAIRNQYLIWNRMLVKSSCQTAQALAIYYDILIREKNRGGIPALNGRSSIKNGDKMNCDPGDCG